MVKQRKWTLAKHFDGFPKASDLKLVEVDLPALKEGDIMVEAVFLSVDPYMRPYSKRLDVGATMIGAQVAKVIESKNTDYPVGDHILSYCGWTDRSVLDKAKIAETSTTNLKSLGAMSKSLALGCLGMPGATAYFGLLNVCRPKEGEVVLVNTAAGAVGSLVGQIAKIKGCKVIGYTGSDEKVKYIKEELGFDHAFNYKTCDVDKTLKEAAPDGVDCYFDNVGGEFTHKVIANHMNKFGRIGICGSIDSYNDKTGEEKTGPYPWGIILSKELTMEGFLVPRWKDQFGEALTNMGKWVAEGKIKYKEYVTEGFEKMPEAFFSLLNGKNIGKAVVKV